MKDLIIIGGGPAGVAAGVYAARKYLKSTLIAEEFGGQSTVSEGIQNWIGTPVISGADLAKALKSHVEAYKGDMLEIVEGERVVSLEKVEGGFCAATSSGKSFEAKAVLIASGASRRKLMVPGADVFEHKGLTYCASCDGPLFAGQDVAVVGGGNAGLETASQLLAYAKSVTLIHRNAELKADPITVEAVTKNEHLKLMLNHEPVEVKGDKFVTGMTLRNKETNEIVELPVTGIFIEIGVIPNTSYASKVAALDEVNRIKTDPKNQRTTTEGIWSAGDCTDELYHQNNIAAGDAVKALEDIYYWLKMR